ncbi:MAG: hypothetical protein ACT4QF_01655 [Sporichthyaceae bacterium]
MNAATKLIGFAAAASAAFGVAALAGSALDPIAPPERVDLAAARDGGSMARSMPGMTTAPGAAPPAEDSPPAAADADSHATMAGMPAASAGADPQLPGLAVATRGYALRMEDSSPGAGDAVTLRFAVESPDGGPVLNFRPTHEKEMHLIVVRRDLTGFQHLHPERDASGTWTVAANLSAPGVHRVFADFALASRPDPLTLGADVFVPGDFQPADLPEPAPAWAADGYEVALGGTPRAGEETEMSFTVRKDGRDLSDLEPYLAAFGHLVSLRTGDLAYLHTHPVDEAVAGQRGGPTIRFGTTFPTAGRYRLFLNFAHAGVVRTAEFTVDVGRSLQIADPAAAGPAEPAAEPPAGTAPAPTTPQPPTAPHSTH